MQGLRIKSVNFRSNPSIIPDGNKSPEVHEVEAEDSDAEKVPGLKEETENQSPENMSFFLGS